jgi:hypothetical protein
MVWRAEITTFFGVVSALIFGRRVCIVAMWITPLFFGKIFLEWVAAVGR